MKKLLALLLTAVLAVGCVAFTGCVGNTEVNEVELPAYDSIESPTKYENLEIPEDFKFGLITLHGAESTYDANFINAAQKAADEMGLSKDQFVVKSGIGEDETCTTAATEFVNDGVDLVFADSFGHEKYILEVARKNPTVQFAHATGTMAHTAKLSNFHNAFASIYEARYLAGIAAGMKLNEMIEDGTITADQAKMGYVGAYTYAEVISGYTSFYIGAKSVCPSVTMEVKFTGSWYDEVAEKETANALISNGCKLISQHADSMGAPSACEAAGVPNVSYNGSTIESCPETFIVSSKIDWTPYFKLLIYNTIKGEEIPADWTGTIATGSVVLTNLNGNVMAEGTKEAIVTAREKLAKGQLNVFDTANFTVTKTDSKNANATVDTAGKLLGYMADVDTDPAYTADTEVVANGVFQESKFRSAPYFDVQIDGITLLNAAF